MKCSGCREYLEGCDCCGKEFKKKDKILCDELSREHFCKISCTTDIRQRTAQ